MSASRVSISLGSSRSGSVLNIFQLAGDPSRRRYIRSDTWLFSVRSSCDGLKRLDLLPPALLGGLVANCIDLVAGDFHLAHRAREGDPP